MRDICIKYIRRLMRMIGLAFFFLVLGTLVCLLQLAVSGLRESFAW